MKREEREDREIAVRAGERFRPVPSPGLTAREGHVVVADVHGGETGEPLPAEKPEWLRDMPFWALSALLHLILFVAFLNYIQTEEAESEEDGKERELRVVQPVRPPPISPLKPPGVDDKPRFLAPEKAPVPGVTRRSDFEPSVTFRRSEDPPAGLSLDPAILGAIGVGPGQWPYGLRRGPGGPGGGGETEGTQSAVAAALDWLRRHQSPDGGWKSAGFHAQCVKPCRNLDPARTWDGRGLPDHDVGVTGLAMLAFTGYGHTHRDGIRPEFVDVLKKAVNYLLSVQVRSDDPRTDGRFGPDSSEQWIYNHAICTMAMAELLVMSNDVIKLKRPVTDAVRLCLRAQNEGYGWRYGVRPGSSDTSVTGWMVLALKAARNARLDIPSEDYERAFKGALRWIDKATAVSGKTGYMAPGDDGSRLTEGHPDPYPFSKEISCMTAVGVLSRIFSGEQRKSDAIRKGVRILMRHPPQWREPKGRALSTINMYYWYYGSYALFQYGGAEWKRWNQAMMDALLESVRWGNCCEFGSWDPIGEWGIAGGRVYSTAMGAMTLEVYYRFRRLEEGIDFNSGAGSGGLAGAREPTGLREQGRPRVPAGK